MRTTPYNNRQLIATRNGLYFNRALQQVVSSNNVNILWNGLTVFGFSLVFCCKTVGNPIFDILSRRNTVVNDGSGYLLRATPSGAGFDLVFGIEDTTPNYTTYNLGYFETGRLYRVTVVIEPFDGSNVWINYKINNRKLTRASFKASAIPVATSQNLSIGGTINYPGYNLVMDGTIHNVSFYNIVPTDKQLEELHTTNVIPSSLHANVIAHYPLNHNMGLKAFDIVGQYNYAKITPLTAYHGDLINYTNDEVGITNPLIQTAWQNIYTNQPASMEEHTSLLESTKALKFVQANSHYLSVADFNPTKEKGYTYLIQFALNADRVFQVGKDDPLLAKMVDSDFSRLKYLAGENGTKNYYWVDFANSAASLVRRNSSLNTDLSKPTLAVCVDADTFYGFDKEAYSGFNFVDRIFNPMQGWDEIPGNPDLFIGRIGTTSRYLDGYISFVGIWKGVLKSYQVANIINNGFISNASSEIMADCQLYLCFDEIINDAGVYKIKDWSPLNRTVVLNNYSLAEITPGNAAYKLIDLDSLR
ncbi:MAG TPA: hypothetical protein VIM65_15835 [Cyclobacteriaceae bacterium]